MVRITPLATCRAFHTSSTLRSTHRLMLRVGEPFDHFILILIGRVPEEARISPPLVRPSERIYTENSRKNIRYGITHLCLRQADAFIWASSGDKHVIMKLPEDSSEENKCPKLNAVHCTQCNVSYTLRIWSMLLSLTLLRCSTFGSAVDIRTLHIKLNKNEKEKRNERKSKNLVYSALVAVRTTE